MSKGNQQSVPAVETRARQRTEIPFPKNTLEDAIRVAQAIEEANGGQPYPPIDTAQAMNLSPGKDEFRNLISSSAKYGLTRGSYAADRISIEPLGRNIVQPQSQEEVRQALVKAALLPEVFASMYAYYRGKRLPEIKFMLNTVNREFSVPKELAELCVNNFVANVEYVGLVRTMQNTKWLSSDATPGQPAASSISEESIGTSVTDIEAESIEEEATQTNGKKPPTTPPEPPVKNAIFVGHGKNRVPLEQLKAILLQFGIPHKIAVAEPNSFRPISQKVAETMQSCGAGILIFTADEEFRDKDNNVIWRPSENVVFELGAASVLYGQKVIIFKEKSVTFPSNFKDIGYIEFEKDALNAKTNDLFGELIAFGLIKVLVGA